MMLMYSKCTEHVRDTLTDTGDQTQPPTNAAARHHLATSPSDKRQSPVLRPDSTVMSEERAAAVPDTSVHERAQSTSCLSASDSTVAGPSTTHSQRPPVWNPFLATPTASRTAGSEGESERRPRDAGAVLPAKSGNAAKHSRPLDDETLTPAAAKKRKTNSDVYGGSSCVELTDAGLRPSVHSPSSSTLDTGATALVPTSRNCGSVTAVTQDSGGSGGVCAPDSSCDDQSSSTPAVKRFDCVVKDTKRSTGQTELTVTVGGSVQEPASLLPLATR